MVEVNENPSARARHFNFDKMYKYLGDDKETIKEILLAVLDDLKLSVQKFEDYIFNERLDDIKATAHKLVGTTASVGLDKLCATVKKLEQLKKFDTAILNQHLATFKTEIILVKKLINNYLLDGNASALACTG